MFKFSLHYRVWKHVLTISRYRFRFESNHQRQPSLNTTSVESKTLWRLARGVTQTPISMPGVNAMNFEET